MTFVAKVAEQKQQEDRRHDAFSVAAAIVQMDPSARGDLIVYMKALNAAQAAGDEEEQEYLVKAILEVFAAPGAQDDPDLEAWEEQIKSTPEGRSAAAEMQEETGQFFQTYQSCKARTSLTVEQIAAASGLSVDSIKAMEEQRVKPQFRMIAALAKAFGVPLEVLNGE
jgi:DNA-binding XRE family transcriptional regulator